MLPSEPTRSQHLDLAVSRDCHGCGSGGFVVTWSGRHNYHVDRAIYSAVLLGPLCEKDWCA
jgi:hypothetical protein